MDDTPLHIAVKAQDEAQVRELLNAKECAVNAPGACARSALHCACFSSTLDDRPTVAALLIDAGADVNARDNVLGTPLHMACLRGKAATARLLVEHGADATSVDRKEWTPLHFASHGGFIDIVSLLLDRGADVDARSRGVEVTPLHKACENDHVQTAQQHGADVNARGYEGYAPRHLQPLSPHMSQLLFDYNADVNLQDCSGWGPLHHAASRGDTATAEMLLHRAVDVNATVRIKGMHVTALSPPGCHAGA